MQSFLHKIHPLEHAEYSKLDQTGSELIFHNIPFNRYKSDDINDALKYFRIHLILSQS